MPAERDYGEELVEAEDTAVARAPDLEDTFRDGRPGGMPAHDDTADTGEMLAAVDDLEPSYRSSAPGLPSSSLEPSYRSSAPGLPSSSLEDAGPTAKNPIPKPAKLRVVEKDRRPQERPLVPPPPLPPRPTLRLPSARPLAEKEAPKQRRYDPFEIEDPPAVGVDPAVFPIHRTAPPQHNGSQIILGLVAVLLLVIATAFVVGGDTAEQQRAKEIAKEQAAFRALLAQRIEARHPRAATADQDPAHAASGKELERPVFVRPPKKLPGRPRPVAMIRPVERKPYAFTLGKAEQPKKYGEAMEHVAPAGTAPLLIVMSDPPALVFRDSKLFGATPIMVPVDNDTQKVTVTLRSFGYREKTIEVRPGESGNLEASVVLEKDPAFEGFKVVKTEKPKSS